MGGGGGHNCDEGCWVPRHARPADVTLVLVGKVGSGKSATANSILGRKVFVSGYSYGSVTETCQMGSAVVRDAGCACATRTVNVIDTPGLFNMDKKIEDSGEDIIKCMDMARDGIHAMIMVLPATSRFSHEDEKSIEAIKMFFGGTIIDHLILVFTNGDRIGKNNWKKMLNDDNCPTYLQDVLKLCKNTAVLFDNETNDKQICDAQLKELLDLVDSVVSSKCGKPFSNQMFARIKEAHEQKDLFSQITKMVEEKLNKTIEKMEKQLDEEKKARQEAEKKVMEAVEKAQKEYEKYRESEKVRREKEEEMNEKYRESEKVRREKEEEMKEKIRNLTEKEEEMKEKFRNLRDKMNFEREQQNNKSNNCIIL
ncbi:unnamed protein product [Urochloa humidicola]